MGNKLLCQKPGVCRFEGHLISVQELSRLCSRAMLPTAQLAFLLVTHLLVTLPQILLKSGEFQEAFVPFFAKDQRTGPTPVAPSI